VNEDVTAGGDEGLRDTLAAGAQSEHPLAVVQAVAAQIERCSTRDLEALLAELSQEPEAADRMLLICCRAAELANSERVWAWAQVRRGLLADRRGLAERANALVRAGFDALDRLQFGGDEILLSLYASAGRWLADVDAAARRFDEARNIYARMLRFYRRAGMGPSELRVVINLLSLSVLLDDLQSATAHAFRLISAGWREQLAPDAQALTVVSQQLETLARNLYAAGEHSYEHARRIAAHLHDPERPNGTVLLILALTAFNQRDFQDAMNHLEVLIARHEELLPEYELWRLHHRMAYCFAGLQKGREAQAEIRRAIGCSPSDPYLWYAAAQFSGQLGDALAASNELTHTIRFAQERMASAPAEEVRRTRPGSQTAYLAHLPLADLRDFALIGRAQLHRRAGDTAAAVGDMEQLLTIGDDTSQRVALTTMADWAKASGDLSATRELLERASQTHGGAKDAALWEERACVELLRRDYASAIELLRHLAHKSMRPERAAELLSEIPQEDEQGWSALKWRGFAKTEAGWPEAGLADLNAAINAHPDDAEALVLRALTRITFGLKPESESWNAALTMGAVRDAMQDLYAALRLAEGNTEARRVLQWLVERAAANPVMYEVFSAGGSREGDLFRIFPVLQSALQRSWEANDFGYERAWSNAVASYLAALEQLSRAGFDVMAARVHLRLADVYLRLFDLTKVGVHIKAAESIQILVNQPLSQDTLEQYRALVAERGAYEKPALVRELEYAWIYDHTYRDFILHTSLRANYRHRVGDLQGALDDATTLLPMLEQLVAAGDFSPEQAFWIVGILRDAGRYADALGILDVLEAAPSAGRNLSFELAYSRAQILNAHGEPEEALEAYRSALDKLSSRPREIGIEPFVQYAASLQAVGRAPEALTVLEKLNLQREGDRARVLYDSVAAYVYRDLKRNEEGVAAVERAVAIVERSRRGISDPAGRRGWLGSQEALYSIGIDLHATTSRARRAWELCELCSSRGLLDELEGRSSVSAEHARTVALLHTIESAILVVDTLTGAPASQDDAIRVEAISRLARLLTSNFDDVRESKKFVERDFDAVKHMLEERRQRVAAEEVELRQQADVAAAAVIDLAELNQLLAG
jgi:hypothetical protein